MGAPHGGAAAQRAMQDLRIEMGILTDQVAVLAGLKPSDLAILDVVAHDGPMSPTQVARRTGVHPATLTGVLARLEADGWLVRTKDKADGRAAVVRPVAKRMRALQRLFTPVDRLLSRTMAQVTPGEWQVILDYLNRTREAVRTASAQLTRAASR